MSKRSNEAIDAAQPLQSIATVPDRLRKPRRSPRCPANPDRRSSKPLRLHELATYRLLTQGDKSGTGLVYDRWLKAIGVKPSSTIVSNSLVALIGLTVSGLGISYLPRRCLAPMIEAGTLDVIKATPSLPEAAYVAMYKSEQRSTLISSIVMLAQEGCDFTRMFQTEQAA